MTQKIPPEVAREVSDLFIKESSTVFRAAFNAALKNRSEAEDAVQEAFQAVALEWDSIRKLSPVKKRAWLCRVAIYKVIDSYRATKFMELTEDQPSQTGGLNAEHIAFTRLASQHCLKVIGEMPIAQRTVAYLRFYEEWRASDIGEFLGISASTVRVHVHAARVMLEKAVGPEVRFRDVEDDGEGAQ